MADNKKNRKNIFIACIVLCILCFIAYYFFSAKICGLESSSAACMFDASPEVTFLLTSFLAGLGNSGLVFSLLWYFGAPALSKMVADRKENLEREIRESAKLKQEAETVCSDAEMKIERLDEEVKQMEKSYQESTEAECRQIAENAVITAERLRKDAEVAFELQSNVAKSAFEKEVMVEAIERARAEITKKIASDAALRNKLIEQGIASLEL